MKTMISGVALALVATLNTPSIGIAQDSSDSSVDRREAFKQCFEQAGVSGPPQQLDETVRASINACLAEKGIEPPRGPRGRGPHHGPKDRANFEKIKQCVAAQGIKLPEPQRGQRPKLDDATRAALDACHEQIESSMGTESGT